MHCDSDIIHTNLVTTLFSKYYRNLCGNNLFLLRPSSWRDKVIKNFQEKNYESTTAGNTYICFCIVYYTCALLFAGYCNN